MKISEVRELSTSEIGERIIAEKARLDQLTLQHSVSPLDNPAQLRFVRKDIARLKTVLRERELNDQN